MREAAPHLPAAYAWSVTKQRRRRCYLKGGRLAPCLGALAEESGLAWEKLLTAEQGSVLWRALTTGTVLTANACTQKWSMQLWAQQLASGLAPIELFHLVNPHPVSMAAVRNGCQLHQLHQLQSAAFRHSAIKLQQCIESACSSCLDASSPTQVAA